MHDKRDDKYKHDESSDSDHMAKTVQPRRNNLNIQPRNMSQAR